MLLDPKVPLFQLLMSFSSAIDLVSPVVGEHHKQVAYIALCLSGEMRLPVRERQNIMFASALHDIGAFSLEERIDTLQFETDSPHRHAYIGYSLLEGFDPFKEVADLVRYHHVPWEYGAGSHYMGAEVPVGSQVIFLADRIATQIDRNEEVLGQRKGIASRIFAVGEAWFHPDVLAAFSRLIKLESFWLNAHSQITLQVLEENLRLDTMELDMEALLDLSHLFSYIIDFRSRFTSTHTAGVASTAEALAKLHSFSARECRAMKIAGYFHDIGKLAIPAEILEKPGKLNVKEEHIMRTHTYHSYRVLEPIPALRTINAWGAFHHERLDGSGYPFHLNAEELALGSRIMAVADIFTAVREERPYRKGMATEEVRRVLKNMAENNAIDAGIVHVLNDSFETIDTIRIAAQYEALEKYERFMKNVAACQEHWT